MEQENSRTKHVKNTIALTSTIALLGTSVGVSHQVKADDAKSGDANTSNTSEATLAKPETLEEAVLAVKATEETLSEQKKELAEVDTQATKAEAEIAALEATKKEQAADLAKAEEILETYSSMSEEDLAKSIEKHEAELETVSSELEQVTADGQAQAEAVAKQQEAIVTETATANQLSEQLAAAEQKVSDLNTMISQPEAIVSEAQAAKEEVKRISDDLAKATANLATVKDTVHSQLTSDLAANKAALAAKEAELQRLQDGTATAQLNVAGSNKLVLPEGYPIEEIKKLAASGYIGTAAYNQYYQAVKDTMIAKAEPGAAMNQYVDIPEDLNRVVDPDNLPEDIQNELAQFAAQMINDVRKQLGLVPVTVTVGSQEFARLLTKSYKATHQNTRPSFVYGQVDASGHRGVGPHDQTIIEESAVKVGLRQKDDNMYENLGAFNEVHTVNGIKRGIYDSIKYMLFTDHRDGNTYGHAVNFLRVDKTDPNAPVYLGFSTSNVGSLNEHFVIFPESDIVDTARFSKTEIPKSGQVIDRSASIQALTNDIASIKGKIASLESRLADPSSEAEVTAAQAKISQLQHQLEAAQAKSNKLHQQVEQLANTKDSLRTQLLAAKEEQAQLKANLDKALALLASSKATLHKLEAAMEEAKARVAGLASQKAQLEDLLAFEKNPNRIELAQEKVAAAKKALADTEDKLLAAQASLSDLQAQRARLQLSIATIEQQLVLLKNLVQEKQRLRLEAERLNSMSETRQLLNQLAPQAAKAGVGSELVATGLLVSKVASAIAKQSPISHSYGAGAASHAAVDDNTQRAVQAGMVMLATAGLATVKLKKGSKKR
ncbi:SEC10/PgrA surface exclusion domain-containing protein [Streptococcus equi subsp. zooepidemicus]|uniref:SEC10/PgrA surface exclusion domain-containing protein n=1 Tax=Streptococcus equi TaxID=1336 RepID=UPI001E3604D0|nr:SEC10/PgrA surface exclusion domain-containing protein [Streptococcus equi]MCD3395220.1 SEC10/PgrA surface exclusion domain-containing protein [Streptococcus equi subsp. zooepidemicus]MCD3448942.1 SEC10/PgrA surface exclusion domain-containing protein [Streptococcus equi subsp. zooepidemicus]HEL0002002.1 SEC10/PgrA surface exclusion domain-containing protein [Streptococcus equi subsp. zooepidemicus]HEL0671032.1 SEC10/PgrA surface exclusion domain-containing protein [Streptococcus equi subsp.